MTYRPAFTSSFKNSVKALEKRYRHIKDDLELVIRELLVRPDLGTAIGRDARKARCPNRDAGRGKSGGYRVIYHVDEGEQIIHFLLVYSKTDRESISEAELRELMRDFTS